MRIALVMAMLAASGCGGVVRRYAAARLGCDRWSIDLRQIDESTVIASGCGRRATYRQTCEVRDDGYSVHVNQYGSGRVRPRTSKDCEWRAVDYEP